jgi:hypothetical protein
MATRRPRLGRALAIAATAAGLCPAAAQAVPAAGITGTSTLVTFDTSSPGTVQSRPIGGLITAPNETVVGIDMRPATGETFILTVPVGSASAAIVRTYRLDLATASVSLIGSINGTLPGFGEFPTGIDFQPLVDRIRMVQSTNENARINPTNGSLAGNDTDLTYMAPATGPVTAEAFDRNIAPGPPGTPAPAGSHTTLYGIDVGSDRLVTQGGIDGAHPNGPNGGVIASVGPLGVTVEDDSDAGFDISDTGTAFASLRSGGATALYTIDLTSGQATPVGAFPENVRSVTLTDNCPAAAGNSEPDLDADFRGDACDDDIDGDGLTNATETATGTNPRSGDTDADAKPDGADACPTLAATTASGCPDPPVFPPPPDLTPPKVTLTRTPKAVTHKRFFTGIVSRIAVGEPAALQVTLLARARSARVAKTGDVVLAQRDLPQSSVTRTVKLKPARRLVGRRKKFSVRLRVVATDAAGNPRTVTRTIRVRR